MICHEVLRDRENSPLVCIDQAYREHTHTERGELIEKFSEARDGAIFTCRNCRREFVADRIEPNQSRGRYKFCVYCSREAWCPCGKRHRADDGEHAEELA